MNTKRHFRAWRRRFKELVDALPVSVERCRGEGDAEQVHQLRVNVRRLRLFVRLGRSQFGKAPVAAFREWAREVADVTSAVRDLDVAIEWLETQPGAAAAIRACRRRRARLWTAARRRLRAVPGGVLGALGKVRGGAKRRAEIEAQFNGLLGRYRRAVMRDRRRFLRLDPEAQHEFRRRLRWWRYCRELEVAPKSHAADPLLGALVGLQEATGGRQNLAMVEAALKTQCGAGVGRLGIAVRREIELQTERIRKALADLSGVSDGASGRGCV